MTGGELMMRRGNRAGIAKTTLLIILATETLLFGSLLITYLFLRADQPWPLTGVPLSRLLFPGGNTLLLILSGVAAWQTMAALHRGNLSTVRVGLIVTLVMGLLFIAGQIFEFNHAGMRPDDPTFGGVFLALMGFHALHVAAGIVILGVNLIRAELGDFTAENTVAIDTGTWFWYYVIVVWVVLFIALYLG